MTIYSSKFYQDLTLSRLSSQPSETLWLLEVPKPGSQVMFGPCPDTQDNIKILNKPPSINTEFRESCKKIRPVFLVPGPRDM